MADFEIKGEINFDESINKAAKKISNLQGATVNVDADTSKAEAKIKAVSKNEKVKVDVTADTSKAESQLKNLTKPKTVKITADTKEAEQSIDGLSSKLGGLGKDGGGGISGLIGGMGGLKLGALGAVAGLGALMNEGSKVESQMGILQARTGATREELDAIRETSRTAFKNGLGEDVAGAVDKVIALKKELKGLVPDSQLGDLALKVQGIATVFDKDFNEVAQKSRTFIKNFGLEGDEAFNLVALGLRDAGNGMDDVLDTLDEYSQLVRDAGFSSEEFVGVLSNGIAQGSRDTDKLADSIKETGIRLRAGDFELAFKGLQASTKGAEREVVNSINKIAMAGKNGQLTVKQVLQQSAGLIETAFKEGKITAATKEALSVGLSGTMAEDIGVGLWSKIFSAPIDKDAITAKAKEAGEAMVEAVQPVGFDGLIREVKASLDSLFTGDFFKEMKPVMAELMKTIKTILPDLIQIGKNLLPIIFNTLAGILKLVKPIVEGITWAVDNLSLGVGKTIEQMKTLQRLDMSLLINQVKVYDAYMTNILNTALKQNQINETRKKAIAGVEGVSQRAIELQEKLNKENSGGGGGGGTGVKKTLEEQIKANKELIGLYKQKSYITEKDLKNKEKDKKALDELISKTRIMTFELERQNKIRSQVEDIIKLGFILKPVNKSGNKVEPEEILNDIGIKKERPIEVGLRFAPIAPLELTDELTVYFEEQIRNVAPLINDFAMSLSNVFKVSAKAQKAALKEANSTYLQDTANLKKQLLNREISLEEYQERSEEIEQSRADRTAEIYEEMNQRIIESFEAMADKSNQLITELLTERLETQIEKGKKLFDNFSENIQDVMVVAFVSVGASLGAMIAEGTANFGDYLKTILLSVIDTAMAMVSSYLAVALMRDATTLGATSGWTIAGLAAANVALGIARGLVGQIGADEGVIGINDRYNKQASQRDTIPIWVRKGESILTPEFTSQHEDLLTHLYGGRSEESYFRQKYIQPVSNYGVNPNGEIVKTNRALLRAIENGIEVKSTNINKIKIVDKTSNGIKYANCR